MQLERDVLNESRSDDLAVGLRESMLSRFRAQYQGKALGVLAELTNELDEDNRMQVVLNERQIIAAAIDQALRGFTEGGGLGLSFDQILRQTLSEILRSSYDVKVAVYRPYAIGRKNSVGKCPSHDDQLRRNAELVDAVDLARENVELRKIILEDTRILFNSRFPAEAFCVDDRADLKVNARQISDLVDNFYLWFLEQFSEKEALVGYLYVFGGLDAKAVYEKVKTFEKKDFAPKAGEVPPEGSELMGSYGMDEVTIEAYYANLKRVFEVDGQRYMSQFLNEVSLQDTDSLDLIKNWREIRRQRDKIFAPVVQNGRGNRGRKVSGMQFSAMNLSRVEKMQIAIPETELAICLEEMNLMRLQRGDLSARNKMLLHVSRLIGSMCRKGYAAYWLKRLALSDAVLDMEQESSLRLMEKMALYNPTRSRFSSFVGLWVRSVLGRTINKEALMPLPDYAQLVVNYCKRYPQLSDQEVVDYFRSKNILVSLQGVSRLRRLNFRMLCLDAPIVRHDAKDAGRSRTTIGDLLAVSGLREQRFHVATEAYRMSIIHRLFALLPPRHAYILSQRYIHDKAFQEIADELGVSRQAVEQIELYALESLRFHTDIENLETGRVEQSGDRSRIADGVYKHLSPHVFLVSDEDAWQRWCAAQTDISDEQMLWFRLYLGLEQSNGFARLNPSAIKKYRDKAGKQIELTEFYRVTRLLRDRLQRNLAALPEEKRFVRSCTKYELFANAGALLNNLNKLPI